MRFVVYGVGAVGGAVAVALSLAGEDVVGIARGRMLDAIQADGLLLRTPDRTDRIMLQCHAAPADIAFRPDDVIVMTMKSQDTAAALQALRAAGVTDQPIVCAQNGVDNERMALRLFPNVYGVTVMIPADYMVPGEVNCFSTPRLGEMQIGRYPSGRDATVEAVAAALDRANFAAYADADVMASKYGKLLENQFNLVQAALPPDTPGEPFIAAIKAEGEAVYRAAGIGWRAVGPGKSRKQGVAEYRDIPGLTRQGSSSLQSLKRGTGSIESDYLNGEIALLGRLHGVPTPANDWLTRLGARMAAGEVQPGAIAPDEMRRVFGMN